MTKAQQKALDWLRARGGDAALDKHGIALAMGETAPVVRATWNALRDAGEIEFYNPAGKGYGRLRLAARREPPV
jgi:hypothetical protein